MCNSVVLRAEFNLANAVTFVYTIKLKAQAPRKHDDAVAVCDSASRQR